jgi:DNA helicase-2/ATP-dependent DNA helicase PcrA
MSVSRSAARLSVQPDPEQRQAIEHVRGPMLVLAGAGTGKTTVLIERLARLIRDRHARADEILALTYTDNAAREMTERANHNLPAFARGGLKVSTFHAYANDLLTRTGRNFGVLDDKQLWVFLRRHIRELRLNHFIRAANLTKFLDDVLDFIRRCQDELVGPGQYQDYVRRLEQGEVPRPRVSRLKDASRMTLEETLARCSEIAFVYATVERLLAERNLGSFGHMMVRANQLLAEDASVLASERSRARFILVDEFQDANFAQIKLLEKLAGTVAEESSSAAFVGGSQNVFAVGDPDQGIYRFRGASSDAFELFERYFPNSKLVVLTRNRRSTTPILKCAYGVIAENPDFRLMEGGREYRRLPLVSARDETAEPGNRPATVETVLVGASVVEAADLVASLLEHKRRSRCEWRDIGILFRIHSHRDEGASQLAHSGVPFAIEGLDVLDTSEVRDLLASLGAVVSAADSAALFRVSAFAQFELDPEDLRARIRALPREAPATFESLLAAVRGGEGVLRVVHQARTAVSGMKAHAALLALTEIFAMGRSPAVRAFLDFARNWEQSPITETGSPGEFLEYVDAFREARGSIPLPVHDEENAVKLMTAHAAKGLEFEHVFVLRVASGSFPAAYREPLIEFPRELRRTACSRLVDDKRLFEQEERRLFYVAMTRARDTLTIYGPLGKGRTEPTPPGYLRELLKSPALKPWLKARKCREFQTEIFTDFDDGKSESQLHEWIGMPPASDLASTLSASAIERYLICPLQFKLEREWRIPAQVSAALHYGAAMHRVLLTYYDAVRWARPFSEARLIELFQSDLATTGISDPYQRQLYEQQGIAQLRDFLLQEGERRPEVLHTEESFSVSVGRTNLVGRIDRIDRASGGHVIITDYKTGKPRSQEDADKSLQLSLYALAAREKWGYVAERLVFHNLEGNTQVATTRGEEELEQARWLLEEVREKIAAGNFEAKPGFHCASCAYRTLCPKTEKRIPRPPAGEGAAQQAHKKV